LSIFLCRFHDKLHDLEEKLENAKLNNKPKDAEIYKKQLQEIKQQVWIMEIE
jgi:hypothetical protein